MRTQSKLIGTLFCLGVALLASQKYWWLHEQTQTTTLTTIVLPNVKEEVEEGLLAAAPSKPAVSNSRWESSSSSSWHEKKNRQPFPRWDDPDGIPLQPILDFVQAAVQHNATTTTTTATTALRQGLPEIFYMIDQDGRLWTSMRQRRKTRKVFIGSRLKSTENLVKMALGILRQSSVVDNQQQQQQQQSINNNNNNTTTPWPHLQRALHNSTTATSAAGFPWLAWYGDYKDCNYRNWKKNNPNGTNTTNTNTTHYYSLPLFTTCARVDCHYAFPLPTYKMIQLSQPSRSSSRSSEEDWDVVMNNYSRVYPWSNKIPQVVWRGGLTGPLISTTGAHDNNNNNNNNNTLLSKIRTTNNTRWRLCQYVTEHPSDLLDIGLTNIPARHQHLFLPLSVVGNLKPRIQPMEAFQQYAAILDIDGNSWSSRFCGLLCYNSVILKVQPDYVDYFYFADDNDNNDSLLVLQPWKHYVPVQSDFSNLHQQAAFVLDPAHQETVRRIVANANAWCRAKMVWPAIARDYLDIFEVRTDSTTVRPPAVKDLLWPTTCTTRAHNNNNMGLSSMFVCFFAGMRGSLYFLALTAFLLAHYVVSLLDLCSTFGSQRSKLDGEVEGRERKDDAIRDAGDDRTLA